MIIDAHHHLWDPARRDYPWMTGDFARLRRRRTVDDLRAVAAPLGVTGTVVVQAATSEEESSDLLKEAKATDGLIVGVVGWVDVTAADVAERIAALRACAGGQLLVGVRHPVQDESDPNWLARPDVRGGLEVVATAGLAYDLLVLPHQLPAARALAEALPDLPLVLDHGAKPQIIAGAWEPWSTDLAALARHEHVHCKLSGLVTEATWTAWRKEGIGRYAARLLDCFGPDRLMFGSDWPVCTLAASYAEVLDLAKAALDGLAPSEREAVLARTARRFYSLGAVHANVDSSHASTAASSTVAHARARSGR